MMTLKIGNNRQRQAFTLIEVMLSTAILAFAMTLVFQSFFMSLNSSSYLVNHLNAGILSSNKAWEIADSFKRTGNMEIPAFSGEEVSNGKRFSWKLDLDIKDQEHELYQININYSWAQNNRHPSVSRSIYILK